MVPSSSFDRAYIIASLYKEEFLNEFPNGRKLIRAHQP